MCSVFTYIDGIGIFHNRLFPLADAKQIVSSTVTNTGRLVLCHKYTLDKLTHMVENGYTTVVYFYCRIQGSIYISKACNIWNLICLKIPNC